MVDDPDAHESGTLWFETLPSNDTARLLVQARSGQVHVVFYWNEEFHSERSFVTRHAAETWGYEFRRMLLQDALAGALLGYDRQVIARLEAQCPLTQSASPLGAPVPNGDG